ncbi:MAG: DUF2220 family protein [Thermoanaerobacteraceae bacterium]|nr:DUF2220 family protein [Thermoanaerobacteraceae bacterium]
MRYAAKVLNQLIDRFERSSTYRGEGRRGIYFRFTPDTMPQYYDDTTSSYRLDINSEMRFLVEKGYIRIHWVKHNEGSLIDKVSLNVEKANEIYEFLGRRPRHSKEEEMLKAIEEYSGQATDEILPFYRFVRSRIIEGKSPIYIDVDNADEAIAIFKSLNAIMKLKEDIPKRVFSGRMLGDTKAFEAVESKVVRILKDFMGLKELNPKDVLTLVGVVDNPGYLYVSGNIKISCGEGIIDISSFVPDVGIPGEMVEKLQVVEMASKAVLTIENLTVYQQFVRKRPKGFLILYLGGFSDRVKRNFLNKLKPSGASFYHWGDIDLGGFEILVHLRKAIGIDIKPYMMDVDTLKEYEHFTKPIDEAYRKKLTALLEDEDYADFHNVIGYMVEKMVRLEQENILI